MKSNHYTFEHRADPWVVARDQPDLGTTIADVSPRKCDAGEG